MESRQFNKRLWGNRGVSLGSPECRLKSQFVYALDKDADVMTQDFAKDFVDLSDRGLSPDRTPKFALNHKEGRLNIRPLVVMLHKGFLVEIVEVPHSVPQAVKLMMMVALTSGVRPKRYVGRSADSLNSPQIPPVGIGFVRRDLIDVESLSRFLHQHGQLGVVSREMWGSLSTGDDMGFDTAHDMSLNPSLSAAFLAPLVVKPSGEGAGGEASRINGKVGLNRPQGASRLLNEGFEQGRQFGLLKVTESAGEGRRLGDQPVGFCFSQVGHKASAGHGGIDFSGDTEYYIGQGQPRTAKPLLRLFNAVAEVTEQGDKMLLLMHLSFIVGRPFLRAGHLDRLSIDRAPVWPSLPLYYELNSVDVLAGQPPLLEVGAGAKRRAVVEVDDIATIARLGRHFPAQLVLFYLGGCCYYQPSFLSSVHFGLPRLSLFCAYNSTHCVILSIHFGTILGQFQKIASFAIDSSILCVLLYPIMNGIQAKIAQLEERGWTLAAIADSSELGVHRNTVGLWKAGKRYPRPEQPILDALNRLLKHNRIPKKRRYAKGSRGGNKNG